MPPPPPPPTSLILFSWFLCAFFFPLASFPCRLDFLIGKLSMAYPWAPCRPQDPVLSPPKVFFHPPYTDFYSSLSPPPSSFKRTPRSTPLGAFCAPFAWDPSFLGLPTSRFSLGCEVLCWNPSWDPFHFRSFFQLVTPPFQGVFGCLATPRFYPGGPRL